MNAPLAAVAHENLLVALSVQSALLFSEMIPYETGASLQKRAIEQYLINSERGW